MIASQLLVLTHEYPPRRGGIATYVSETVEAARAAGWKVTVLAPHSATASEVPGLRVVPTTVKGTQGWIDRFRMYRAVRRLKMDWAQTVLWLPEPGPIRLWLYPELFRLPHPKRLVLTLHGSEILRLGAASHRRRRFRTLLEKADRVGVVSQAVESLLRRLLPGQEIPIERVPGAVNRELAAAIAQSPEVRRSSRIRLLTVGRIHPRKGQLAVVEAIGRLPPEMREEIEYELIGPIRRSRYAEKIRKRARDLKIKLQGPSEAPDAATLANAYRRADVMVLASKEERTSIEGFGLVYLEAAAAGCPVIATAVGGAPEAIGSDNGLMVSPKDPQALAQAIERLVQDAPLRERLGRAGPAWAARFSWSAVVARLFNETSAPPDKK